MAQLDRLKAKLDSEAGNYSDALLTDMLESAKHIIMTYRFPSGSWPTDLEARYLDLQVRMALELVARMGAEGQTAHSENGISRTFDGASVSPALLAEITPVVRTARR